MGVTKPHISNKQDVSYVIKNKTFKYKIHVQMNTESVQCLSKKYAYHNKVHVIREQLS